VTIRATTPPLFLLPAWDNPAMQTTRTLRLAVSLVVLLAVGVPAAAQRRDRGRGGRPVVVEIAFTLERLGQRGRAFNIDRSVELAAGERLVIAAMPFDQRGRRFPLDRFRLDVDADRNCRGRVEVSDWASGELRVRAGNSRGRCTVAVWVPGNLNLEYALTFEVGGLGVRNYSRRQSSEVVERLYRAVLQRDIDQGARRNAVAEVERGELEPLVASMIASPEFQQIRGQQGSLDLITAFYRGLLQREPDGRGMQLYLNEVGRGRYTTALMNLIQSEEFERSLSAR
jgi:hypothetical protein